ncbi:liver-expressed antimicrobial peptide 2-like isoform X1 [Oncorhynchus masou masou]|uniref:liver-expressed antimicrobial peptide 2-like isoform X1 n=1 Tax=Oncorhynchus masou masou TaxID=90313 RepID=UPI003183B1F1
MLIGHNLTAVVSPQHVCQCCYRLGLGSQSMSYYSVHTSETLQYDVTFPMVQTAPVPEDWTGLITRAKRSLLWRWNTLKPVGTSCREHDECGTKYCRKKTCSFQVFIS